MAVAPRLALVGLVVAAVLPGTARAEEFTRMTLSVGGAEIELMVERVAGGQVSVRDVKAWVERASVAVSSFYGVFPVRRLRIVVWRIGGRGIHGTAYRGSLVRMRLGLETRPAALTRDWTMTHELFHLGFPDLPERHLWMQEGLSTYFEPIARARVGDLPAAQLWRELFRDLPQGLPREGDDGLDRTRSWGATYWGGALFWFLADIQIRERTGNRKAADDALRAIRAAGGTGDKTWTMDRVLEVGDRATGTVVLSTLYHELSARRFDVDLDGLAARLGVTAGGLDDRAPLAAIRRSITRPPRRPGPASSPSGPPPAPTRKP